MAKKDLKKELNKELMYQKLMPSSANISEKTADSVSADSSQRNNEDEIVKSDIINSDIEESRSSVKAAYVDSDVVNPNLDVVHANAESLKNCSFSNQPQQPENAFLSDIGEMPFQSTSVSASSATPVGTKSPDDPIIVNLMEYLVDQKVNDVLAKFNCCDCVKCRQDTIALALNKLPPKYVVVMPDQLIDFTQHKAVAEILTALIQAVLTVRSNPRHEVL